MNNECMRGAIKYKNLIWGGTQEKHKTKGQNNTTHVNYVGKGQHK